MNTNSPVLNNVLVMSLYDINLYGNARTDLMSCCASSHLPLLVNVAATSCQHTHCTSMSVHGSSMDGVGTRLYREKESMHNYEIVPRTAHVLHSVAT